MKLAAIPGADAALGERPLIGDRRVGFAEHHIGAIGRAAQRRLVLWHGVGRGVEIGRRAVAGAVVLVVGATTPLQHWRRGRHATARG